jgi:hypothetical protein
MFRVIAMFHWDILRLAPGALAALLIALLPAGAQAAECRDTRAADPEFLAAQKFGCRPVAEKPPATKRGAPPYSAGILWRIEKPGIAPSYLLGTFHTTDPRIKLLPCPIKKYFDASKSYTMELIFNGAGFVGMSQAMFLDKGQTLEQVLGKELHEELIAWLKANGHRKIDQGFDRMKPWAIMMTLGSQGKRRRTGGGLFLDAQLQFDAIRQGKPTYGLETMAEQVEAFDGMPLKDQVALLRDSLRSESQPEEITDTVTRAYLARDLAALMSLSTDLRKENPGAYDTLMDRLLVRRNRNMAERMPARLNEGNAFIAVGALHLPGEDGVLNLLARAGWRVTPVY